MKSRPHDPLRIRVRVRLVQVDLPELQGASCEEIAVEKCRLAALEVKGPVMCEDTSLCYHALKGLPGGRGGRRTGREVWRSEVREREGLEGGSVEVQT